MKDFQNHKINTEENSYEYHPYQGWLTGAFLLLLANILIIPRGRWSQLFYSSPKGELLVIIMEIFALISIGALIYYEYRHNKSHKKNTKLFFFMLSFNLLVLHFLLKGLESYSYLVFTLETPSVFHPVYLFAKLAYISLIICISFIKIKRPAVSFLSVFLTSYLLLPATINLMSSTHYDFILEKKTMLHSDRNIKNYTQTKREKKMFEIILNELLQNHYSLHR